MSGAFVRASALACAREAVRFEGWPYHRIAAGGADWRGRAQAIAQGVAAELRAQANLPEARWRALPCFVGSSSFSIGAAEAGAPLEPPAQFCRALGGWFDTGGPVLAVSTACTSGLSALQAALDYLVRGGGREALVLGVELVNRLTVAGFAGLQLLSRTGARPCDHERDGLGLGEALGAAAVSAEPGPWRVAALASGVDAQSVTGPAPGGEAMAATMREALARAQWQPRDDDLVKLQAAGSPLADLAEARALHAIFSPVPRAVSLKGAIGHTLGASGPAELALLCAALARGEVPATAGFHAPDPELGLTPAPGAASSVRRVLFNLSGFGGSVMTLALERHAA